MAAASKITKGLLGLIFGEIVFLAGLGIFTYWWLGFWSPVGPGFYFAAFQALSTLFSSSFFLMPVGGVRTWRLAAIMFLATFLSLLVATPTIEPRYAAQAQTFILMFLPWFAAVAALGFLMGRKTVESWRSVPIDEEAGR